MWLDKSWEEESKPGPPLHKWQVRRTGALSEASAPAPGDADMHNGLRYRLDDAETARQLRTLLQLAFQGSLACDQG